MEVMEEASLMAALVEADYDEDGQHVVCNNS